MDEINYNSSSTSQHGQTHFLSMKSHSIIFPQFSQYCWIGISFISPPGKISPGDLFPVLGLHHSGEPLSSLEVAGVPRARQKSDFFP